MGCLEHDELFPSAADEPVESGEARSQERVEAVDEVKDASERRGKAAEASVKKDASKDVQAEGKKADVAPKPAKKKAKKPKKPNNVRKLRIERMMSKAELARRANLSVLTVDRVEKGFGCRMNTKRKILEALGLSLADRVRVFGEEE